MVDVITPPRLRDTCLPGIDGTYNQRMLEIILNRELYPTINKLQQALVDNVTNITTILNRFIPRFATGASNAVLVTDENALICVEHGSACTLTLSQADAATFVAGASIAMVQYGAGQLTFAGSGLTVRTAETLKARKQYSICFVSKLRDDEWIFTGDMELA